MHEILKTATFNFFSFNILKIIQNLSTYFLLFIQFFKYNIQANNETAPDNTMLTTGNSHVFNTTKARRNNSLKAATTSSLLYGFPQEHFHFVGRLTCVRLIQLFKRFSFLPPANPLPPPI